MYHMSNHYISLHFNEYMTNYIAKSIDLSKGICICSVDHGRSWALSCLKHIEMTKCIIDGFTSSTAGVAEHDVFLHSSTGPPLNFKCFDLY